MSKSNMLLGLAKGRVGDLVFYRDGGEQRTRTRVIPKNPRSSQQMAQRVRLANVTSLYRLLAPVVRDSFSNRPSNQSGYNAFASGAIELSPFLTKEEANADVVLPMPAVIAKGVLQGVDVQPYIDGSRAAAISIPSLSPSEESTVAAVSSAIMVDYPSIKNGDKITLVAVGFSVDESFSFDAYKGSSVFYEFNVDTTDNTLISSISYLAADAGRLLFPLVAAIEEGSDIRAVGAVVSRVDDNGTLQSSFSRLFLSPDAQELYDGYRTNAALQEAIESYKASDNSILR